ncbi:MAG TPA: sugar phosphate isomerase/epimerase family protein [Roseiflexaceae bacterium]|nr:sugar phosphate isomerase/epimerase family protein [Roseiflexaceae bacterium]HMP41198.1 sugar phosphate isomerase/epimerase family protein [Roseiflexaceae bacterium]
MKLSCLPVSLYPELSAGRMTPGDWLRLAAACGLDGADLSVAHVPDRSSTALDALRDEAAAAGVSIAMLATYSDFTQPETAARAREIADLRGWIAAAQRLGVALLRVTAGQAHHGVSAADGIAWAVEGLTSCLAEAEAAGVHLVYENHVRGAFWQQNDFSQPAERFLEIVRRTAGTGLGILFDIANPLVLHDDPIRLLHAVLPRIGAVHLSDMRAAGVFEPAIIGSGVAPLDQAMRIIAASGFTGWYSIEEASRNGIDGVRQAVKWVRSSYGTTTHL